jgi:hypothetical protein
VIGPGLRRRVEIAAHTLSADEGEARAVLEDDFHHFRVWVRHRHRVITAAGADSPRHPYSTCPLAGVELRTLVGMPLASISSAVFRWTDARHQCTHMLDLAGLAVAAAGGGVARRRYDAEVPDRVEGRSTPRLRRDGTEVLAWEVDGGVITGPEPFSGVALGAGFAKWVQNALGRDEAEAALVLRRCVAISIGRNRDLDAQISAEPLGRCFSQQPDRARTALRMHKSTLDFSDSAESLREDDFDWLQFSI